MFFISLFDQLYWIGGSVLGGVLVVCAGVLLITKRRMNKNA